MRVKQSMPTYVQQLSEVCNTTVCVISLGLACENARPNSYRGHDLDRSRTSEGRHASYTKLKEDQSNFAWHLLLHDQNAHTRRYVHSGGGAEHHSHRQRREVSPAPGRRHPDQTAEIGRVVVASRAARDDPEGSGIVEGRRSRNVELEVECGNC